MSGGKIKFAVVGLLAVALAASGLFTGAGTCRADDAKEEAVLKLPVFVKVTKITYRDREYTCLNIKVTNIPVIVSQVAGRKRHIPLSCTATIWHQDSENPVVVVRLFIEKDSTGRPHTFVEDNVPFNLRPNAGQWRVEIAVKNGMKVLAKGSQVVLINPGQRPLERTACRTIYEGLFKDIKDGRSEVTGLYDGCKETGKTEKAFPEKVWKADTAEVENQLWKRLKMSSQTAPKRMVNPYRKVGPQIGNAIRAINRIAVANANRLKGAKRIMNEIIARIGLAEFKKMQVQRGIDPKAKDAEAKTLAIIQKEIIDDPYAAAIKEYDTVIVQISYLLEMGIITASHLTDDLAFIRALVDDLFKAYKAAETAFTPPPAGKKWLQGWLKILEVTEKQFGPRYKPSDNAGIQNDYKDMEKVMGGVFDDLRDLRDELLQELYERHAVPEQQREGYVEPGMPKPKPDPASKPPEEKKRTPSADPLGDLEEAYERLAEILEIERDRYVTPLIKVHADYDAVRGKLGLPDKRVKAGDTLSKIKKATKRAQDVFDLELYRYTLPRDVARDIRGQELRLENLLKLNLLGRRGALPVAPPPEPGEGEEPGEEEEAEERVGELDTMVQRYTKALFKAYDTYGKSAKELLENSLKSEPLPEKPELKDPDADPDASREE